MYVVLPTAELIHSVSDSEDLFNFYRDSTKGLIADMIVQADSHVLSWYKNSEPNGNPLTNDFTEKVLLSYYNSPEAIWNFHSENTDNSTYIEAMIVALDYSIAQMLLRVFGNHQFKIKTDGVKWINNNLVIVLE